AYSTHPMERGNPRMVLCARAARTAHRSRCAASLLLAVVLALLVAGGCTSNKVSLRSVPSGPLVDALDLTSWRGPKPSARTVQLLRVCNLSDEMHGDYRPLLKKLQAINDREPSSDTVYAMSELAFIGGKKNEGIDHRVALDLYGASVLHAYEYLFDPRFCATRNPYDPQYRGVCDLYNGALEAALRIVCAGKELLPGVTKTINTASGAWDITCTLPAGAGSWRPEDFDRFEFVSDYQVTGLKNLYVNHGLGVPLIAIRRAHAGEPVAAKYYPPKLSFPVTAFLRPVSNLDPRTSQAAIQNQCVLELYDPLIAGETIVGGRHVPLESDLTTPLAFFFSRPEWDMATIGLLRPEALLAPRPQDSLLAMQPGRPERIMGLYMVQPYEPGKIPVLMVHGLWSSPMTWMEMFNDLRSQAEIRKHFQFWFYLYPTGQPFWQSAAQLRRDLVRMREVLDPEHREPSLDQMVVVGHSMGGLVSRMQTLSGGDDYWRLVSGTPLSDIKTEPGVREKIAETFYFQPNPSIRRVVTIATPCRGSTFSNQTTQWLLGQLIHLPERLVNGQQKLFRDNPGAFANNSLARIDTSIDSLSPSDPIFPVMLAGRRAPWVTYHNIVGVLPRDSLLTKLTTEGDGVVPRSSAHVDDAVSEITVPADHSSIHSHPAAVLEVRRILLEHLAELEGRPVDVARR
ncbi:MAG: alpha/beta fold hydrolase, partial [Planctomycetaceae bacterium]|nr:alpha/beta fold hydrolase [Planctomycetaceae bacterium]